MATGLPVITTNLGGTADYVRPELNAVVCAAGDPVSLGNALLRVLDDAPLRTLLQAEGLVTAQRFHPDTARLRWLPVFERLLGTESGHDSSQE